MSESTARTLPELEDMEDDADTDDDKEAEQDTMTLLGGANKAVSLQTVRKRATRPPGRPAVAPVYTASVVKVEEEPIIKVTPEQRAKAITALAETRHPRAYLSGFETANTTERVSGVFFFSVIMLMVYGFLCIAAAVYNWVAYFLLIPVWLSVLGAIVALIAVIQPFTNWHWALIMAFAVVPLAFVVWTGAYAIVYTISAYDCQTGNTAQCTPPFSPEQIAVGAWLNAVPFLLMIFTTLAVMNAAFNRHSTGENIKTECINLQQTMLEMAEQMKQEQESKE